MTSHADIQLAATRDDPSVRARALLGDRADEMCEELAAEVTLATEVALSGLGWEGARARLVRFCGQHVRRYLSVADRVMYAAAGGAETGLLVRTLREQHRFINAEIDAVERAVRSYELHAAARALLMLVEECLQIERLLLLPAMAATPGIDLPMLIADVDALLRGGALTSPEMLDVRPIPHGQRHPRIFGVYARLRTGASFVLVNNHDPKPLRQEFEASYPAQFGWEYLQPGPTEWRVRIERLSVPA